MRMLERREQLRAEGLAASLRQFGQAKVEPVWGRLAEIKMPVLLCAGDRDAKYSGLAREMAMRLPTAKLFIVPDAGHMAHLENSDAFVNKLREFLRIPIG